MIKTLTTYFILLISAYGKAQGNLVNLPEYCLLFCGTVARDTNTFSFLASSYKHTLENLNNDSLLILLELSEDEIFIQRHENENIISDLYELSVYNMAGKKSITGSLLQEKYSSFYHEIIRQSQKNPKIVVRGYKNLLQNSQIGWIRKYYPEILSKKDSSEIADVLINERSLNPDSFKHIKNRLDAALIDDWDKAYIGTWLEDLTNSYSNELYPTNENYWMEILTPIRKKIMLSPYEQAEVDYTPLYFKRYFKNPTRVLLCKNEAILTNGDDYKIIRNKKYHHVIGFALYSKNEKIYLFNNKEGKYTSMTPIKGSYYGNW